MTKTHIALIGVEMEGAYKKLNFETSQGFKHDGSVKVRQEFHKCKKKCICSCELCKVKKKCCVRIKYNYIGEVVSQPMKLKALIKFMDNNYPIKTNRSTGLHCHFSFKNVQDYGRLLERKFYYYLLDRLEKFGRENKLNPKGVFWERLKGKNTYCNRRFLAIGQKNGTENERYTIINACYKKYGTLEIRVLPAFQKKRISLKAVKELHNIIEDYLNQPYQVKKKSKHIIYLKDVSKYADLLNNKNHPRSAKYAKPYDLQVLQNNANSQTRLERANQRRYMRV